MSWTDLSPTKFKQFLSEMPSKKITVNYDTGNSASLGYDINEEFKAYGKKFQIFILKIENLMVVLLF